jgi:hypothetical protein
MSKVKQHLLSETPCVFCDQLYPAERAKHFDYCINCAKHTHRDVRQELPILCMGKTAYQAYSHDDARNILKQSNPKRTT